jgi:hypothetical protein
LAGYFERSEKGLTGKFVFEYTTNNYHYDKNEPSIPYIKNKKII